MLKLRCIEERSSLFCFMQVSVLVGCEKLLLFLSELCVVRLVSLLNTSSQV